MNACGNPTVKELMSNAPPKFGCNLPDEPHSKRTRTKWSCVVCKVTTKGKKELVSHFQGKRHEDALEKLKVKIETARSKILAAVMETRAAPENKEMATKAGCNLPDEPHSKNVEMPWTCSICRVTITAETSLISHLQGRRHKDTCEKLKILMQTPKTDTAWWCNICNISCSSEVDLGYHLNGSKHLARTLEISGVGGGAQA